MITFRCLLLLQVTSFISQVSAEECTIEGDVRLADGASVNEGRVEVCVDGEWGTVCNHNWGSNDAHVVCSQLGLTADHADALYRYGGGSGPIHYAGFHCTGEESRLVDCAVDQQASIEEIANCLHTEDAGVHCTNVPCVDNETRLNEEVVQICHNQEWSLICADAADGWDDNAAEVMCNEIGIPSQIARSVSRGRIFYDAPIILNSIICTGTEDSITECRLGLYMTITNCTNIAVAQCEVHEPCSSTETIRLTQSSSDRFGRLEVCSGEVWGTVCGNGATINTIATVACRELNHATNGLAFLEHNFGVSLSLVPITRTNMVCTGFETAISECSFDGADGNSFCDHSDDIIVLCSVRECNETEVRLVSGQTPDDGRVEICLDGLWGGICDDRWDIRDAEVVCRQLNYNGPSYPLQSYGNPSLFAPSIHLDDVDCDGTESMLSECSHQGIGIHNCVEGDEEAGVICTNVTCEDGSIHLVGGDDISRGRVEYCFEGTWYSVCASDWEDNGEEARVVCSTLGYNFDAIITNYGRGTSPILPLNIQCGFDDTTLSDCTTTDLNTTECPHVAGINCGAFCLTVGHTDCNECTSRADCGVTSNGVPLCECYSDCYEYGDCCSDVSHVKNCVVEECETGDIRLVGGGTNSTGRLEVCGNGIWGKVCNRFRYWGTENARVVCRQLGFSEHGAYVVDDASVFGVSDKNPLFGEVHCVGTEPDLFECSHTSIGIHSCGSHLDRIPDVAISCYVSAEECVIEGDVRLVDGRPSINEGRVEVCVDGEWGTVCDHNWGSAEAQIVCNQLGLAAEYADALYRYGGGSGPIHYAGFHCTGEETRLIDCAVDQEANIVDITNCQHFEDAGVQCINVPCVENETRLNEEVVQICHNQQWGLICADSIDGWDDNAAQVMCNHVGNPSKIVRSGTRRLIFYDAPVILNTVICTGTESSITECFLSEYDIHTDCTVIAITQCEMREPCSSSTDTIRLTHLSSDTIGRLEVCSGDKWGTVCGIGATIDTIATVACRELDHAAEGIGVVEGDLNFILSLVPITRTNMVCTGFETAISECSFDGADGNSLCDHSNDIIVVCSPRECNEDDIRLVSGQTPDDGRVEICLDGLWGSICDSRWDIRDAEVVCRQLQYNGPSYPLLSHDSFDELPPIHISNVHCNGSETMLSECSLGEVGLDYCREGISEAAVICTNITCEDGTVHLVGGNDVSRGRVEYCYEGTWYSVCASDWEDNGEEARVVCSTLGYNFDAIITNYGRGTSRILPMNIQCGIDDTTLNDCTTTDLNTTQCSHVAGVNCGAFCLTVGLTDCNECTSRAFCGVTSNGAPLCECYSDCYEYGDCCSDVSHVKNCVEEVCETGDIQLVGGVTNSTGRLEVCGNGIWGRVCNRFQYWGTENARVVCRQLGFSEYGAYVLNDASVFGVSDKNPLFGEVHCVGTEPNLFECSHTSIGVHSCGRQLGPILDIAISCYDEDTSCVDGDVRLQDGVSSSNGRVEFCQYRTWGTVCSEGWDDNDARVVCGQLGYSNPEDASTVEGFEMANHSVVFLDQVDCSGTETELSQCANTTTAGDCRSAGVACVKCSNTERCSQDTQPINMANDNLSFGKCEVYEFPADVCNDPLRLGVDYVYVSNKLGGSQNSISTLLNDKIQSVKDIIATHDMDCVDQVFKLMCHYYLPPCGNSTHFMLPPSLCKEECIYVKNGCRATWQAAAIVFTDPSFIDCDDTSHLLCPLPNCCTDAGIIRPESTSTFIPSSLSRIISISNSPDMVTGGDGIGSGEVAGIVIGILLILLALAVGFIVVFLTIKNTKKKKARQMEMIQFDIMRNPGIPDTATVVGNAVYEVPIRQIVNEQDGKGGNLQSVALTANSTTLNPYSWSTSATNESANLLGIPVYENLSRVPSQYLRELTRGKFVVKYEDITLLETIGEGEFGIVYKGKVGSSGRASKEVAIKTLKGDFDQIEVDQFVEESWKMSRFKHSHVMGLTGVCLDTGSAPFIIMPYMANGSLLKYLKMERGKIVLSDENDEDEVHEVQKRLTVMCSQIASGMEYLVSEKYIHRDLAARNCMIDKHFLIKITDFGLSEDVFVKNYFRQGSSGDVVKLPVKWMAPESLSDGHFSEKSDVWSYGVTMWEIFSGGKAPFPGTNLLTLVESLETGQRLSKPLNTACTDEIYVMMKKCWEKTPRDRPTFKEIYTNISKYIEHIAGYLDMGFNPFAGSKESTDSDTTMGGLEKEEQNEEEMESDIKFQVTPPSVKTNGAHDDILFPDESD